MEGDCVTSAVACALCDEVKPLKLSHIVSAFVFRELKRKPGPPGKLVRRTPSNDAEVVQDGDRLPMLCWDCEQKLGHWEKSFKEQFFVPFHKADTFRSEYGPWLALFCASLVWRILYAATSGGTDINVPAAVLVKPTETALDTWKGFLKGELRSTGRHELHLLGLTTRGVDPQTFSYVEWTVDTKVTGSRVRGDLYVLAKLIGVLLVGVIRDPKPKDWRHSQLYPGRGVWDGNQEFWAPGSICRYLEAAARTDAKSTHKTMQRWEQRVRRRRR